MALDPKVKNFLKFIIPVIISIAVGSYVVVNYLESSPVKIIGYATLAFCVYRVLLLFYRRVIQPAKKPSSYGKWAVITGTTSGIGKVFTEYLVSKEKMKVLVISRNEDKLKEQLEEIKALGGEAKYLVFDFSCEDKDSKNKFYKELDIVLEQLHNDGGIGLLINNAGTTNSYPMNYMEMTTDLVDEIVSCNIQSLLRMTRAVLKYMEKRNKGAVLSISSGSGALPAPMLSVYASTKAFMTEFTQSLKVEYWDTGIDFYVITPFYFVSNLYKRKQGTIIAPLPIKVVEGAFSQLGKKLVLQGHGYYFHGLLYYMICLYPFANQRWKGTMKDNRSRYDARQKNKSD